MIRILIISILVMGCLLILSCIQRYIKSAKKMWIVKIILFTIYLGGYLYFTFFSREAGVVAGVRLLPF